MLEGDDGDSGDEHKGPRGDTGPSGDSPVGSEGSIHSESVGPPGKEVASEASILLEEGHFVAFVELMAANGRIAEAIALFERHLDERVDDLRKQREREQLLEAAKCIAGCHRVEKAIILLALRDEIESVHALPHVSNNDCVTAAEWLAVHHKLTQAMNLLATRELYNEAVDLIVQRRAEQLVRYARYHLDGDHSQAIEVCQVTFGQFPRALQRSYPLRNVDKFLNQILWCQIKKAWQKRKKSALSVTNEIEEAEQLGSMGDLDTWYDHHRTLARALEILKPHERAVVEMHHLGGLEFHEIAEILEKPLGTVSSWCSRAIKKLREFMDRQRKK